MKKIKYSGL